MPYTKGGRPESQPPFLLYVNRLEHLWLVVLLWSLSRTLTTWTSWASVIAAWTTVVVTTWTAVVATVIVTAWTSVASWLALWFNISFWLLEEGFA